MFQKHLNVSFLQKCTALLLVLGSVIPTFHYVEAVGTCSDQLSNDKAQLEEDLKACEAEAAKWQAQLDKQKQNSNSLSGDISVLQTEINQALTRIKQKNGQISGLSKDITKKSTALTQLHSELDREKSSLAQIIRKKNELDNYTLFEYLLSNENVSGFYGDADSFEFIQGSLARSFDDIQFLQGKTEEERKALTAQKNAETDARIALEQSKKQVETKQGEKNQLLTVSKDQEKSYQQVLAQKQAQAAKIRSALFSLAGNVQGGGIPFGDAVKYAKEVSAKTGVRPALILAILKQESNMGKNVGTCNRPGDSRTWKDIMPGPTSGSWRDDQTAYLQIMKELGLSPDGQALSCPLSTGGWGGAMGPTQFIPTTWLGIRIRLAALLGVPATNPWNPRHAVFATALYMKDLGAAGGGFTAERDAACKYYSGRSCSTPGVQNLFYGNSVMNLATQLEADIKLIDEN